MHAPRRSRPDTDSRRGLGDMTRQRERKRERERERASLRQIANYNYQLLEVQQTHYDNTAYCPGRGEATLSLEAIKTSNAS